MAFKASNPLLAKAYEQFKGSAYQVKRLADNRSVIFTGDTSEAVVIAVVDNLNAHKTTLQANAGISGLAAYAKIQEDDQAYDIDTEYAAMILAIDAVLDEITANIPAPRIFSIAQLATLQSSLATLSTKIS